MQIVAAGFVSRHALVTYPLHPLRGPYPAHLPREVAPNIRSAALMGPTASPEGTDRF
ncbi:hypothetical protein MMSP_4201 [Mycobacterium sp. 012931]|nr:hypothetical protein MMSP_4201 [Mycobacterium sp. 012931]